MNDPFVQQLLLSIDTTLSQVKVGHCHWQLWPRGYQNVPQEKLLPSVFGHVFSEMTAEVAALLEQQIMSCEFNQVERPGLPVM